MVATAVVAEREGTAVVTGAAVVGGTVAAGVAEVDSVLPVHPAAMMAARIQTQQTAANVKDPFMVLTFLF